MVFEQLFRVSWIQRKENSFILGFIYSIVGIISAKLIFPANVGLMSVAFTSVLLIPSLNSLLRMEENVEIREKKLSLRLLLRDHKDIFKVYINMFLGIYLAYSFVSLLLDEFTIERIFESQLNSAGISGFALFEGQLMNLILNNLLVFIVAFMLSVVYGAGSLLFLTWNASVWGVAFTYFVKQTASVIGDNPFHQFANSVVPFLPHMVTEALAYVSAAIVGGIVSKAVLREKFFSKKFHHIMTDALIILVIGFILVIVAGIIEVKFFKP